MEIIEIDAVVTRKENPFIADVKQLIAITEAYDGAEDKTPGGVFRVDNKDAAKSVFYIQQAAIAEGYTARLASPQRNGFNGKGTAERQPVPEVDEKGKETGQTVLVFKITTKRKGGPRKKTADVEETTAE